ncbi:MAG TPA: response regulator [Stellaceae bacterium]|nr:response regulator [Stellaceae bacterium]
MYPDGQHILVIDDEAGRRQLCEGVLREAGFAVIAVSESVSAIRAAASRRFMLVLAAVDLPGTLDGLVTVRQIRARQPWLRALFVGEVAQRPLLRTRGRDDFIPSPFNHRDLLGCVFELMNREVAPLPDEPRASRRTG